MQTAFENLSKHQLLILAREQEQAIQEQERTIGHQEQTIEQCKTDIERYKAQVAQLQRMLFGQKRERFQTNNNSQQLSLPFEPSQEEIKKQEVEHTAQVARLVKKQSAHQGRLALPKDLPVVEIEIYPPGNLEEMVCIGQEITDELDYAPAKLFIRRYIRHKYVSKQEDQTRILIGDLPERVIEKGRPGSGLLANILVDKYMDHLPLYRQRQRFLRDGVDIADSTLNSWAQKGLESLEVLHECLLTDIKSQGYLQVDETPIRVLDSNKKGSSHQGYYWVYHSPLDKSTFFDYQPSRGSQGPKSILSGFKGYLQSDGYGVYSAIAKENREIKHLGCWAHARREFEISQSNDEARSVIALDLIQDLYKIEEIARQKGLSPPERKELRLDKSLPILNQLGKWITEEAKRTLPKSQLGKAMAYCIQRWDALSMYLTDGSLEIDNNLVENAIRPVALGRKNYLFAGSHASAKRAGMIYSFFAMCKKHEVNPFDWLKYVLENILITPYKDVRKLYPQNFKQMSQNQS